MNNVISNILRFLLVLLLQIFICNYTHLFGFLTPPIYLLALLLLPLEMPKFAQYLIGFASGLIVDMFTHTLGVNAFAATVLMFVRPYWVKVLNGRNTTEGVDRPVPGVKDFKWMAFYVLALSFVHQFFVVILETFSFHRFGHTSLVILGDTVFTTFVLLCLLYIFFPARNTRN